MRILFFGLASRQPVVALVTEREVLKLVQKEERILEHELLPLIEEVLQSAQRTIPSTASRSYASRRLSASFVAPQHDTFAALTHIACVTGPGGCTPLRSESFEGFRFHAPRGASQDATTRGLCSFTSVRLGVATANALAYALKIPIAGVPLRDPLSAFRCQELEAILPQLLSTLSYGASLITPEYGSRPFITRRESHHPLPITDNR